MSLQELGKSQVAYWQAVVMCADKRWKVLVCHSWYILKTYNESFPSKPYADWSKKGNLVSISVK